MLSKCPHSYNANWALQHQRVIWIINMSDGYQTLVVKNHEHNRPFGISVEFWDIEHGVPIFVPSMDVGIHLPKINKLWYPSLDFSFSKQHWLGPRYWLKLRDLRTSSASCLTRAGHFFGGDSASPQEHDAKVILSLVLNADLRSLATSL
jgi:hypothetical protein